MRVNLIIGPRNSGKTTLALYEFMKNPTDTLFLTRTSNAVESTKEILYARYDKKDMTEILKNVQEYSEEAGIGVQKIRVVIDNLFEMDYYNIWTRFAPLCVSRPGMELYMFGSYNENDLKSTKKQKKFTKMMEKAGAHKTKLRPLPYKN